MFLQCDVTLCATKNSQILNCLVLMKLVTVSLSGLDQFPSETCIYSCMTCSQLSIHNTGAQSIVQWWIGVCMGGHLWLAIVARLYI